MPPRTSPRQEPYTCGHCPSAVTPVRRCKRCRAARAAATAERRDAKRAEGICLECTAGAIRGQLLCVDCQAAATARSRDHHAAARDVANRARRKLAALRSA